MSALRAGERLEVTVERAVYRGQGLARHEGQVVFVPRGLPGDVLRVRVASVTPGYVKAEIERDLAPYRGRMPERVLDQIKGEAWARRLLGRHGIPRLSLFHL